MRTELIEFRLNRLDNLFFEDLALTEQFLHGHRGDNAPSFSFDDSLDYLLDMIAPSGYTNRALGCSGRRTAIGFASKQHGILLQSFHAVRRANSEDSREGKLQLLNRHRLDAHAEVERSDANLCHFLKR